MLSCSIMGVLNVTPDSFSDGNKYNTIERAYEHAQRMASQGADIIDIGGESTRPGAKNVALEEELRRTIPVIQKLKKSAIPAHLSIDTSKPQVMHQAIAEGIDFVNDVDALQNPDSIRAVKSHKNLKLCVMHKRGTPQTMQNNPNYTDVLADISHFFTLRINELKKHNIDPQRVYLDPGFGFGKTLEHNITIFRHLDKLKKLTNDLHCAGLLIGVSRKSFIGRLSQVEIEEERLAGSISASVIAMQKGVDIIRVHDVAETRQALQVAQPLIR